MEKKRINSFQFYIPGRLPGLNEIVDSARAHWSKGRDQKKEFTSLCGQYVIASQVPFFLDPVTIRFDWYEKDMRRDLDNITAGAKFILDALVNTRRLRNDTRRWVRSISHGFPDPDKTNPRVGITIETVLE